MESIPKTDPKETQTSEEAPSPGALDFLTIKPYGAEVFTDFARRKSFLVLFFKHEGASRPRVLAWIGEVLDELTHAGIHIPDKCQSSLIPDHARTDRVTPKTKWRCHLQVPVQFPEGFAVGERGFVSALLAVSRED